MFFNCRFDKAAFFKFIPIMRKKKKKNLTIDMQKKVFTLNSCCFSLILQISLVHKIYQFLALALSIKHVAYQSIVKKINGKKISMASILVHYQKTKFESVQTITPPIHILTHVFGNERNRTRQFSVPFRPLFTAMQT